MIISCANEKGGTGKTSTTALLSWELAKLDKKVLMVDCDPQANLTDLMIKTKSMENTDVTIDPSLFALLINNRKISDGVIHIKNNLDLIPAAADMNLLSRWLDQQINNENDKIAYLKKALNPISGNYDFVFMDVSPTMSLTNDNVFMSCDWIILMLQTQQRSFLGSKSMLRYLQTNLIDEFHANVDVLGILPVLTKNQSIIDNAILTKAIETFGSENIFENYLTAMERVKRYDMTGITDEDKSIWDKATHSAYRSVAREIILRLDDKHEQTVKS